MSWLTQQFKQLKKGWDDFRGKTAQKAQEKMETLQQQELAKQQKNQQALINQANALAADLNRRAQETADLNRSWAASYLSQLQNAPNIAFNQGLAGLNQGIASAEGQLRKQMAARGLGGSGIDLGALLNAENIRSKGISSLQGSRAEQELANAQQGYNLMSGVNASNYDILNNAALQGQNAISSAYSYNGPESALQTYYNTLMNTANQPSGLQNLVQTIVSGYFNNPKNQFKLPQFKIPTFRIS